MANSPGTPAVPARRVYVDALKGLGIILVVWGHFEEYYRGNSPLFNGTFECIYLFHMALFCLCSGLVARFNIKKLILQQVWLYLLCQAAFVAFRQIVLTEDFSESGGMLTALVVPWRHMWYLYALIFWELTLPLLALLRDRFRLPGKLLGVGIAIAIGLAAGAVEWPFAFNRVFCYFPFYAAGVLFREEIDLWFRASRRLVSLRVLPGVAFAAVYGFWFVSVLRAPEPVYEGARIFNDVAYNAGYTAADRAMFYLIGLATSLALIAVLGNVKSLASLGKRTLPIYILHMPVYAFLVELGTYEIAGEKNIPAVAGWVFLTAGGCICLFGTKPFAVVLNFAANIWYKILPGLAARSGDRTASA
ncbi:acyltransferase family protein [uncultured Gemmiger sp.]|uniref:acyltransferase family protein n=1 Tax=uncultured Gemmiger sp. TaxID=1623490 RepID=UPI0025D06320|nr:acyltransferase family protein [uncultured Gemmiger sp.]